MPQHGLASCGRKKGLRATLADVNSTVGLFREGNITIIPLGELDTELDRRWALHPVPGATSTHTNAQNVSARKRAACKGGIAKQDLESVLAPELGLYRALLPGREVAGGCPYM